MSRKAVDTRKRVRVAKPFVFARLLFVFGLILLAGIALVVRIAYLNKNKGDAYERKVLAQQSYASNVLPYKRGDIVDRNNNKLATSVKVYNLILDPVQILSDEKYIKPTIKALVDVFGLKEEEIKKILDKNSQVQYYVMKEYKGLKSTYVEKIEKLQKKDKNIKGVWFEEEYVRKYPYSSVGSNVIGFCTSDNTGSWGIENYYNSSLNGVTGRRYGYFDADLNLVKTVKPATNGNTIVSSIDVNIQGILEQHMKKFLKDVGALNMGCIIMNPNNGEIYAMASNKQYDLNNPRDLTGFYPQKKIDKMSDKDKMDALSKIWRNFCISDAYEPGSTFKPFTVCAALDEGITNTKRTYLCDGGQDVNGTYIKCVAHGIGGHGQINICQSLMKSCNDVMMQLGADMGKDTFLEYVNTFGFGARTGIDLPGEAVGGIFTKDTMHSVELATSSFGQGQTVTMIQMAAGFSALVNGGNYYEPHVVKEIDSESGAVVSVNDDKLVKRIITEKTSKLLRNYLYKTVEEGTAMPAQVEGYTVGGKTGTAQKHPVGHGNYLVSFIGCTPVKKPEVVIYTVIDEPKVEDQAHSTPATEFSSQVLTDILPMLGIYPDKKDSKKVTSDTNIKLPSTKKGNKYLEEPEGGAIDKDYKVASGKEGTDE
ncbi:MAG: peptidoglycan glycosyltransferase [Lachnospiraceae bacterium]|nr:peptidoglycan glycosyltransferase [Lachnospiraceae bacterium]